MTFSPAACVPRKVSSAGRLPTTMVVTFEAGPVGSTGQRISVRFSTSSTSIVMALCSGPGKIGRGDNHRRPEIERVGLESAKLQQGENQNTHKAGGASPDSSVQRLTENVEVHDAHYRD